MRVALLQMNLKWADPEANRSEAVRMMDGLASQPATDSPDLYILPEMFSTGFATRPAGIAEREGESLQWMQMIAARTGSAICGSIATEDSGRYFNRMYFVTPEGHVTIYDKRHLFTYGGENKTYTRGENRVVACWRGCRILLEVCYDLRFPVWSRNTKTTEGDTSVYDYDMAVYVASWPESRQKAWDALLRARAIENQCWVAGVNRVGDDPSNHYAGGTALINPYGETIAAAAKGKSEAIVADADMDMLQKFRGQFPVLDDADVFTTGK